MNDFDGSAEPRRGNGLGLASFIVSIPGLCICPLGPLALLMGFIALRRQPRGFAITGIVLGGLETIIFILSIVGFSIGPIEMMRKFGGDEDAIRTEFWLDAIEIQVAATQYRTENGDVWPTSLEDMGITVDNPRIDDWENDLAINPHGARYRLETEGSSVYVVSPGEDLEHDTDDDCRIAKLGIGFSPEFTDPQTWK